MEVKVWSTLFLQITCLSCCLLPCINQVLDRDLNRRRLSPAVFCLISNTVIFRSSHIERSVMAYGLECEFNNLTGLVLFFIGDIMLARFKKTYQKFSKDFWLLMTASFVDMLGRSLVFPFFFFVSDQEVWCWYDGSWDDVPGVGAYFRIDRKYGWWCAGR